MKADSDRGNQNRRGEIRMDDKEKNYDSDFREVVSEEGTEIENTEIEKTEDEHKHNDNDDYEDICYICRRPESKAGKMIKIPNDICICADCMQKTFDSMNNPGFPMGDFSNLGGMPNISLVNMSDLQNMNMIPKSQKLKKKKAKEDKKTAPVLDIKSIPAPHKIKASLDEYVVGQEQAKKVMSVAVYNQIGRASCRERV